MLIFLMVHIVEVKRLINFNRSTHVSVPPTMNCSMKWVCLSFGDTEKHQFILIYQKCKIRCGERGVCVFCLDSADIVATFGL